MNMKIKILTITKCKNKNTDEVYTRVDYIPTSQERILNKEKQKGVPVCPAFFDISAFDKLSIELINQEVVANVENIPDERNPLRSRNQIISLETKNGIIDLL